MLPSAWGLLRSETVIPGSRFVVEHLARFHVGDSGSELSLTILSQNVSIVVFP